MLVFICTALLAGGAAFAQQPPDDTRRILVVTASAADYVYGAGATLAHFVEEGWRVDVAQFGNDEKASLGQSQAQTRLANGQEGRAAAKLLGVKDIIRLDHKSGELAYVSSTEMRSQLFALIRGLKPRIIFFPDPYVHYQDDRDLRTVGLMAEEAVTRLAQLENMALAHCFAPSVARLFKMRARNFIEQGAEQIWWDIGCHSVQIGLMTPTKGASEVTVAAWIDACWQDEGG